MMMMMGCGFLDNLKNSLFHLVKSNKESYRWKSGTGEQYKWKRASAWVVFINKVETQGKGIQRVVFVNNSLLRYLEALTYPFLRCCTRMLLQKPLYR